MRYFQLYLRCQPVIAFACSLTAPADGMKKNIIDHRKDMIEFYFNTAMDFTVKTESETYTIQRGSAGVFLPDRRYELTGVQNGDVLNTSYSVAVSLDNYDIERRDTAEGQDLSFIAQNDTRNRSLLLPETAELDDKNYQSVTLCLRELINHFFAGTAPEYYLCISKWYELAALLDAFTRSEIQRLSNEERREQNPSENYYVYKTKKYIAAHYSEHISIPDIARSVGVSPNYLSALFKKGTGGTVVGYLNYIRVLKIRDMLNSPDHAGLSEICELAGIQDKRYARRLFKKYFGVSMQRCMQLENGITLLHDNPWEKERIESDIYNK